MTFFPGFCCCNGCVGCGVGGYYSNLNVKIRFSDEGSIDTQRGASIVANFQKSPGQLPPAFISGGLSVSGPIPTNTGINCTAWKFLDDANCRILLSSAACGTLTDAKFESLSGANGVIFELGTTSHAVIDANGSFTNASDTKYWSDAQLLGAWHALYITPTTQLSQMYSCPVPYLANWSGGRTITAGDVVRIVASGSANPSFNGTKDVTISTTSFTQYTQGGGSAGGYGVTLQQYNSTKEMLMIQVANSESQWNYCPLGSRYASQTTSYYTNGGIIESVTLL